MSNKTVMDINGTTLGMISGLKEDYINGLLECANQIGADLNIKVRDINIVDDIEMPTVTTMATICTGKRTSTIDLNKQYYDVMLGYGPLQIFGIATVIRNAWRDKNRGLVGVKETVADDYTYDTCANQEDIIDSYAYGFLVLEDYFDDRVVEFAFGVLTQDMSDDMAASIIESMNNIQ